MHHCWVIDRERDRGAGLIVILQPSNNPPSAPDSFCFFFSISRFSIWRFHSFCVYWLCSDVSVENLLNLHIMVSKCLKTPRLWSDWYGHYFNSNNLLKHLCQNLAKLFFFVNSLYIYIRSMVIIFYILSLLSFISFLIIFWHISSLDNNSLINFTIPDEIMWASCEPNCSATDRLFSQRIVRAFRRW